jgi:hypothetical protein
MLHYGFMLKPSLDDYPFFFDLIYGDPLIELKNSEFLMQIHLEKNEIDKFVHVESDLLLDLLGFLRFIVYDGLSELLEEKSE